jgi:hypothetical protein
VGGGDDTAELGSKPRAGDVQRGSKFGRMAVGILILLSIVSTAALAFWFNGRVEPATVLAPEAEPKAEAEPEVEVGAEAEEAQSAIAAQPESVKPIEAHAQGVEESTPPEETAALRPARLTVVVFPWGNVWIDGKPRGQAPLKNDVLKPGRYEVSVGQERPVKTQTVRLRPGQRKTLDFDLTK